MVNAIHLTMSNKDQIATWKANRRKLVRISHRHVVSSDVTRFAGILHRWYARLHRTRDIPAKGIRKRVRLVVTWRDHVRVPGWISTLLLRVDA